ncbi:hypothetical protein F4604DRAFT_1687218 [Suillus subluteus]|nr:hypothetical protein F4604DRAFT_1687218 [Suillus subluteus]
MLLRMASAACSALVATVDAELESGVKFSAKVDFSLVMSSTFVLRVSVAESYGPKTFHYNVGNTCVLSNVENSTSRETRLARQVLGDRLGFFGIENAWNAGCWPSWQTTHNIRLPDAVRLDMTERTELVKEAFAHVLEGFVILQKNPGWDTMRM